MQARCCDSSEIAMWYTRDSLILPGNGGVLLGCWFTMLAMILGDTSDSVS